MKYWCSRSSFFPSSWELYVSNFWRTFCSHPLNNWSTHCLFLLDFGNFLVSAFKELVFPKLFLVRFSGTILKNSLVGLLGCLLPFCHNNEWRSSFLFQKFISIRNFNCLYFIWKYLSLACIEKKVENKNVKENIYLVFMCDKTFAKTLGKKFDRTNLLQPSWTLSRSWPIPEQKK